MIPTKEEYEKAKEIVAAYQAEKKRLFLIEFENFKSDLSEYFKTHKVDGCYLEKFNLDGNWKNRCFDIIPVEPSIEECYGGENDEDIKKIGEKYNIGVGFVYWMYPK